MSQDIYYVVVPVRGKDRAAQIKGLILGQIWSKDHLRTAVETATRREGVDMVTIEQKGL